MKQPILIKFGNKVRQKRLEKGFSQEELAEKAGVHRTYIGMIERAEKNITLSNIEKIALALDIHISSLLEDFKESWVEELKIICEKYNIGLDYLPSIINDPKVLPMIRGKSFEFSALFKLINILDRQEWDVSKLVLNPQFGSFDQDVTITHLVTNTRIRIECKLAAKGRYRKIKNSNLFQIDVKCMRSRTLGKERVKTLAPIIGVSEDVLTIHNDQYRANDFDLVVTSIANCFYETNKKTSLYEWQPNLDAIEFLKILGKKESLDLDNVEAQRNFAFNKIYIAKSTRLTATSGNNVKCSRKKCLNKDNCGFIPNYPKITFNMLTGKPIEPWCELEDCSSLLHSLVANNPS